MTDDTMTRILIAGAGAMGSQIGLLAARAGLRTAVWDIDPEALHRAQDLLTARSARDVARRRADAEDESAAFARLRFTTDLNAAAPDADLVIEAVVERLDVKRDLFARLDALCPPRTVLASNTSGFVPSQLADATDRADRVCVMHFFNPALVMACVEVVRGPGTSQATVSAVVDLARRLGKRPVVLDREIPGFVANRILNAVRDEAIRLVENGIAGVATVDAVCRDALGYPMGPFQLMDLTGIDIGYHTKQARFEATGDPADAPSRSVTDLVAQGHLGRKTGRGWYVYDEAGNLLREADRTAGAAPVQTTGGS